jgi:hypothetical protein
VLSMPAENRTCPHCEGTGELELQPHLDEVLRQFGKCRSLDSHTIAGRLSIRHDTACHRLMDLTLLGLLQRERKGGVWIYSRTGKKQEAKR